jgi:hypothetical protein
MSIIEHELWSRVNNRVYARVYNHIVGRALDLVYWRIYVQVRDCVWGNTFSTRVVSRTHVRVFEEVNL